MCSNSGRRNLSIRSCTRCCMPWLARTSRTPSSKSRARSAQHGVGFLESVPLVAPGGACRALQQPRGLLGVEDGVAAYARSPKPDDLADGFPGGVQHEPAHSWRAGRMRSNSQKRIVPPRSPLGAYRPIPLICLFFPWRSSPKPGLDAPQPRRRCTRSSRRGMSCLSSRCTEGS